MIKNKKQSMIIVGAFIFVLMLFTTTYAFFNYTRTGTANNIRTGKIYFNADGGNNTVTLSDLFPISVGENETITSSTPGVGSLKLHITGDTTYTEGIEYLIEAVEVTGNGNTSLPISIDISYTPTEVEQGQEANVIGTSDNNYFTNRGGETSRYKLLSTGSISEGEDILVGYIAPGATGIDGELNILAYLDADNIAITDTYPSGTIREVVENYSVSACETALTGLATASTVCASSEALKGAIDNNELTSAQITALLNAGVITEYTNETTSEWVSGRTVFTTEEWNALHATGVSFKIKTTANEGTWVEAPIPTIESCPGCEFMYPTNLSTKYYYSASNIDSEPLSTRATFVGNNDTLVSDYTTLNKNYFLGFKFDGSGNITNAYACGIKGTDYLNSVEQNPGVNAGTPFCIEGALSDTYGGNSTTRTSVFTTNSTILNDSTTGIWQGRCGGFSSGISCPGSVFAYAYSSGDVNVGGCTVNNYGSVYCS